MTNHFQIRFEVLNINWIKSDDGWVETNIGFCQGRTEDVGTGGFPEDGFDFIERGEERDDGFFVSLLGGRESGYQSQRLNISRIIGMMAGLHL